MRTDAEERLTSPPFTFRPHSTSAGRAAPTRRRPLNPATLVTLTLNNTGTNLSHKQKPVRHFRRTGIHCHTSCDAMVEMFGTQLAKSLVSEGQIGEVVTAVSCVMSRGMEHWHPNPAFFYQKGAGR